MTNEFCSRVYTHKDYPELKNNNLYTNALNLLFLRLKVKTSHAERTLVLRFDDNYPSKIGIIGSINTTANETKESPILFISDKEIINGYIASINKCGKFKISKCIKYFSKIIHDIINTILINETVLIIEIEE